MAFLKATRKQAKLRIALDGPSGSGKTMTALKLAKALGGRIAVIDTEHESASLYTNVVDFDTNNLTEFSLKNYIDAIAEAAAAGYENLVIDSLSHAWQGKGGALEQVDKAGGSKFNNGWKTVTPLYNQLIESILGYPGNIIVTMRSKMAYEVENVPGRGAVPKKIGMQPIIREGSEYEFAVVLDLDREGNASVSKTRCQGAVFIVGETFDRKELDTTRVIKLKQWLSDGAPIAPVDEVSLAIRMAATRQGLEILVPRLQALPETDRNSLRDLYIQRVNELSETVAAQ